MKIESLRVKNFKAFKNVEMTDIPRFCVIVGANGSGKSTLFNVFGFLKDAINTNVHAALIKQGGSRGLSEVRSRNSTENIEIELKFRATNKKKNNPIITYFLSIGENDKGRAIVTKEILKYRRGSKGKPWEFLNFNNGEGQAVTNEELETTDESKLSRDKQKLKSPDILAIKGLAQFEKFPAVVALGNLIESWQVSDIHISQVRKEQDGGVVAEHLSREGENLSSVIEYLHENHKEVLDKIIEVLKQRIPGIVNVEAKTIETGQVLLKIKDSAFDEPFLVRYVSDGTIKMLAYLVLLYDPAPHPLLCVEEPENQLYPKLLSELAEEFRAYSQKGEQVFVSTHSPDFLNAVKLDEVFLLVKENGYTLIKKAADNSQIKAYMEDGDKMGYLWKQGFFNIGIK